jgi:hypothetical protein
VGWTYVPQDASGRSMKLKIHLNLMPRLRMSGVLPPLSLLGFMMFYSGTDANFYFNFFPTK